MGKYTEFLYLNEQEMIEAGVLDMARCIDVEEEIFKLLSVGDYRMGGDKYNSHGIMVKFPKESEFPNMPLDGPDRRFMAMPAYVGGRFNVSGVKWYGSNIINPSRGLPRSILMMMLNDPDTCEPIALMSGNLVSSVRTGCVPGVATRYLARKGAEVCACVGAGPVSKSCFEAIRLEAKELKEIVVCDLFIEKDQALLKDAIYIGTTVVEAVGITYGLKYTFDRRRPYVKYPQLVHPIEPEDSPSFPSGHTAAAFSLATSLSITYPKWYVIAPSALWACGVGFARMNQGVHYPSDVLTGAAIGVGCAFVNVYVNRWLNKVLFKD